jgi:hypothetical protein
VNNIKYRAWNTLEKRWADSNEQLSEISVSASVRPPSVLTIGDGAHVLQMFTGLSDANGKDIYEGDLMSLGDDVGEVDYYKGSWRVKTPEKWNGDEWRTSLWDAVVDGFEVIGNIYDKE